MKRNMDKAGRRGTETDGEGGKSFWRKVGAVALVCLGLNVSGQSVFTLENGGTNLQAGRFRIDWLAVTNVDGGPVRVTIYDAPGTNLVSWRTNWVTALQAPIGQAAPRNALVQEVSYAMLFTVRLETNCYSPVAALAGRRVQNGVLIQANGKVTGMMETK